MSDITMHPVPEIEQTVPKIRIVGMDRPWLWLERGWRDIADNPGPSLAYGVLVAMLSWMITGAVIYADYLFLLLPMLAGFALVAPFVAGGLYELSRRHHAGLPVTLTASFSGFGRNAGQIGLMGVALLLLHLAWLRFASLLFMMFFSSGNTSPDAIVNTLTTTDTGLVFLIVGTLSGGVLAAIAFAISAISIPMLMDRDINVFLAIRTSLAVVLTNWPAMALWAAIIAMCTLVGLVTFYLGLAVLLPLVGHATWHAYRDLVADAHGRLRD